MGDDATDHEKPMCCAPGVLTEFTIMAMCRSGGRSAIAVNLLAQAGFKHDYNIVDGMEGDINGDFECVAQGKQAATGWKNSDCPWTKKLTPERTLLSSIR